MIGDLTTGRGIAETPVPESGTVCGDPEALSLTLIDADRAAASVGVNVIDKMQFAPAASVPAQPFVRPKSPVLAPVSETLEMVSVAPPVLVNVVLCDGDVWPTTVVANVSEMGEKLTEGTAEN